MSDENCRKILGHLADGVTPILCILDAGHDRTKTELRQIRGTNVHTPVEIPGSPHVARVEVPA